MRPFLVAVMLAFSTLGAAVAPSPVVAQTTSVAALRAEITAKLNAKIAVLQAEIASLNVALANPALTPSQRAQLNADLRQAEARLKGCQLDLVQVNRLPPRALLALNARLPAVVSPV